MVWSDYRSLEPKALKKKLHITTQQSCVDVKNGITNIETNYRHNNVL
jgi:hypothetical protein